MNLWTKHLIAAGVISLDGVLWAMGLKSATRRDEASERSRVGNLQS